MFASPRTKKTKPFPQQEVEKTFSNVVIPMMKETNFAKNVGKDKEETIFTPEFTGSTASGSIPATDESYNSTSTESFFQRFRTKKTKNAFHYTKNDKMYLHIYEKVRGFKVLSYEMQSDGRAQVFNPENGEVYHCETRSTFSKPAKKLTQDAIVFDTKEAAMSERFSINQHRVSKSGSGVLPRVLVQFGKSI